MIFVGGLVVRGGGEAMGCHARAGRSVNLVHVQYFEIALRMLALLCGIIYASLLLYQNKYTIYIAHP